MLISVCDLYPELSCVTMCDLNNIHCFEYVKNYSSNVKFYTAWYTNPGRVNNMPPVTPSACLLEDKYNKYVFVLVLLPLCFICLQLNVTFIKHGLSSSVLKVSL